MLDISNPKYRQRDDETDEEYSLRICSYHESDDLIWDEVARIINEELGITRSESKYRREWKAYTRGRQDQLVEDINPVYGIGYPGPVGEPGEPGVVTGNDETRFKYATSIDRIAYNRELRQDARFERFYKLIAEAIKNGNQFTPPEYVSTPWADSRKEYVLTFADPHIGAKFDSVNNHYSIEEVKRRFQVLYDYMVNFVQEKQIKKLKMLSLGDIVQGILRISDLKLNEIAVVDSFVTAMRLIADFINNLSAYCEIEFIQVCFSNHDQIRPLGTKASELASEDMGKILYAYLTDVLASNKRVTIVGDTDKDYIEFNILGFNCIALHGHQVNNIVTISKDLQNRHRKFFDYVFLAHSHSAKELIAAESALEEHYDIETLVAPSFIGSCPYADKLMVGSKAACKIFGFDPKYGHTESYKIILN